LNDEFIRASLGISYLVAEFLMGNLANMSIFMFHASYPETGNGLFCLKYSWNDGKLVVDTDTNYPNGVDRSRTNLLIFYISDNKLTSWKERLILNDTRRCWERHPHEDVISVTMSKTLKNSFWDKIGHRNITPGLLGEILKDEKVREDIFNVLKNYNHFVGWWSEVKLKM
jgi:hypothetical protein